MKKAFKRPFLAWFLMLESLLFSIIGWLRFQQALVYWDWFQPPFLSVSPLYLVISGVLWGVVGLTAVLMLWFRWHPAQLFAHLAVGFYVLWYWTDRMLLTASSDAQANLVFSIMVTLCLLLLSLAALYFLDKRDYFLKHHSEESLISANSEVGNTVQ